MLRRSDNGSAVVEFLLILFPLGALAGATVGSGWLYFAATEVRVIAAESAWQLAEGDTEQAEVQASAAGALAKSLGANRISFESDKADGVSAIRVVVDSITLPGGLGISSPEFRVTAHAANEN